MWAYNSRMTDENNEKSSCEHEQKAGWLAGVLTGWGVPGSIARILAGAIVGALAAIAAMSQSGCSVSVDVLPDSSQHWECSITLPEPVTINHEK